MSILKILVVIIVVVVIRARVSLDSESLEVEGRILIDVFFT